MKCVICGTEARYIFTHKILKKYDVQYFKCSNCGAIFTEKPYWIDEAYRDSITCMDTGIMKRNMDIAVLVNWILFINYNRRGRFLDYAGGYGIFTRLMRDVGYNFLWDDKYSINLLARGYSVEGDKVELVTALEAFEHFTNPLLDIENILKYSHNVFSRLGHIVINNNFLKKIGGIIVLKQDSMLFSIRKKH